MSNYKTVTMTRDGGHYWRAMAFNWVFTVPVVIPVSLILLLAVLNPFWFRDSFFNYIHDRVNRISIWRNCKMYQIYLGCNPAVWHASKD